MHWASDHGLFVIVWIAQRDRSVIGSAGITPSYKVGLQAWHINPAARLPTAQAQLGQLHSLGSFAQAPAERLLQRDIPQEKFPLDLERVVVFGRARHLLPALEKIDRLGNIRIPHRPRRFADRLDPRFAQPGDAVSLGAVDLYRQ